MALIIGAGIVGASFFGSYLLYKNKNTIVYQLLKIYTNITEHSKKFTNYNDEPLHFNYITFNNEEGELNDIKSISNTPNLEVDLEDDFTLSKIENNTVTYYSFTKHFNLIEVYNDYYDNKNKTDYVSLLEKMINTNNSILAASATIYINNRLFQKELDISFIINYFVYPNSVIYLTNKYKFLILHFINEHYNMKLNIKDLIDNSDNIWISYYLISFDGDSHEEEEIVVTMDENGLSRIFID